MKFDRRRAWVNLLVLGASTLASAAVVHAADDLFPGGGSGPMEPMPVPEAPKVPGPDTSPTKVRVAPEAKACPDVLRALIMPAVTKAAQRAAALYPLDAPNAAVRVIRSARDSVRRKLQKWQGHDLYPVVAIDDATQVRARAFAKETFGKLDHKNKNLIDFAEVQDDYKRTLEYVEGYAARTQDFVDETAALVVQRDQLKAYLAMPAGKRPAKIEIPRVTKAGKDDAQVLVYEYEPWSEKNLRAQIAELDSRIKERIGEGWKKPFRLPGTPPNEADRLALEQAIQLKRLETFRAEFAIQIEANPEHAIPEEIATLLKRTDSLYEGPIGGKVKSDYRPPDRAINNLHWLQLRGESRSLAFNETPFKLAEDERKNIVEFIRQMPKSEQQALGVENVTEAVSLLKRAKWGRLAGSLSATGVGTLAGWPAIYEFFLSDAKKKQNCAAMAQSEEYGECVVEYLSEKFPIKYLLEVNGNPSFFGKDGKISDPKILAELNDVGKRRDVLLRKYNRQAEMKDSIISTLRDKSVGDDAYRLAMIESPDDESFKRKLLGSTSGAPVEGYLAFRYERAFRQHRDQVVEILALAPGSQEQQKKLAELKTVAFAMATELDQLLYERQDFVQYGSSYGGSGRRYPQFPGGGNDFPGYGDTGTGSGRSSDGTTGSGGTTGTGGGRRTDPRNPIPVPGQGFPRFPTERTYFQKAKDYWTKWPEKLE